MSLTHQREQISSPPSPSSRPNIPHSPSSNLEMTGNPIIERSNSLSQLQPFDGVFANINAKPDIMKLPPPEELDPPPPYTTSTINSSAFTPSSLSSSNFFHFPSNGLNAHFGHGSNSGIGNGNSHHITREIDREDIVVSGKSLGSYWTFFFGTIPSIVFNITGFLLMFYISESHSTFYGSLVGLGISILINTADICDFLLGMSKIKNRDEKRILEAFILIIGMIFVIYPWSMYEKLRRQVINEQETSESPSS